MWATPDGVNENNGACFATYPPERISFVNSDRDSSGPRLVDDRAISLAKNWTSETEVQTKFLHLFGDFSQPAISRHMSGNSAPHLKEIFLELYRQFESPSVRQQVVDIAEIIVMAPICTTFPSVSVSIRENSKLRVQITAYSSD